MSKLKPFTSLASCLFMIGMLTAHATFAKMVAQVPSEREIINDSQTGVEQNIPNSKQVINSNTQLHNLGPAYKLGYGLPKAEEIKQVMDRVLHYIDNETPAVLVDKQTGQEVSDLKDANVSTQLKRGGLRITSYEWGVTYSALLAAFQTTGDAAYRDYVFKRHCFLADIFPTFTKIYAKDKKIDGNIRQFVDPQKLDDSGAMCASMIKAQLLEPTLPLRPLIDNYIDFIYNKEYRLDDGTLARQRPHQNSLWLDDMFMGIPPLAYMGRLTGDTKYYDEAARQVMQFAHHMWVPEKKLFRHGWVKAMEPHPAFFWGRANGWAILTLCEVLDILPEDHPQRPAILDLFRQHAAGLAALQQHDGFWHQLLNDPDTYLETSCTAMFSYCLAHGVNRGWIDGKAYAPVAILAWHAVASRVNESGQVEGTCVGTGMGFDPAFYAYRPASVMAAHGYGPTIWAGSEIIKLIDKQHPNKPNSAVQYYDNE